MQKIIGKRNFAIHTTYNYQLITYNKGNEPNNKFYLDDSPGSVPNERANGCKQLLPKGVRKSITGNGEREGTRRA